MTETLHVYGQGAWHDDVLIVGTREALYALGDALKAIAWTLPPQKMIDAGEFFVSDGEGFTVKVCCADVATMDTLPLPYTEEAAATPDDDPRWAALMALAWTLEGEHG